MSVTAHLWESTLCAGAAALLSLALRRGPAAARYAVWLAASIKFLLPFSMLTLAGGYVNGLLAPADSREVSVAIRWLGAAASSWNISSFTSSALPAVTLRPGTAYSLAMVWAIGFLAVAAWRWRQWRDVRNLARGGTVLAGGREVTLLARVARSRMPPRAIPIVECEAGVEPGIFGIRRPVLIWPAGLSARLSDRELDALLAHEACHVDRRDNLGALLSVAVETIFWFHPVVWWISSQLVNERERACDERVIQLGSDQRAYAEGIMKVCGFVLRAPTAFVAGVGNSNLSARIERIFRRPPSGFAANIGRGVVVVSIVTVASAPLVAAALRGPVGATAGAVPPHNGEQKVYDKGDGIQMPTLEYEVKPAYPPEAMDARIQGNILLSIVVLDSGAVGDVAVTKSLDKEYGLDNEAVKAAKQWRFKPGTKDGKPVAVRVDVEMTFTLK
jgi:TonB family protein